ncbi:phage capsid protein [Xenorhabdus vietnamensis]|uniref:Phage capsid protein n=1 Tax=Xenorhabdus vietnamensis TaxID=351656 RepID=A0A1Y2SJ33_9GAMM|nr:phage capsid protein [Xenorhabdus vietnamensis]
MLMSLPAHYIEFMPDKVIYLGDFKRGYFIVDHETDSLSFGFSILKKQWDIGQKPYIRTALKAELRTLSKSPSSMIN